MHCSCLKTCENPDHKKTTRVIPDRKAGHYCCLEGLPGDSPLEEHEPARDEDGLQEAAPARRSKHFASPHVVTKCR